MHLLGLFIAVVAVNEYLGQLNGLLTRVFV